MPVFIDAQELQAESLGIATVGQVLAHVSAKNRLIVSLTIDGRAPDLKEIDHVRAQPLHGKTVYIETNDPAQIVTDICRDVTSLLAEAEDMRLAAIDHLQAGQSVDAFRKLAVCFNAWNHSQESVKKLSRLLRLDLDSVQLDGVSLAKWLTEFTRQLSDIRTALEARDFVQLSDVLSYEADKTNQRWQQSLEAIRRTVES